jgi:hypothetical protein
VPVEVLRGADGVICAFEVIFFHSLLLFIVVEDSMLCITREFLPAMFNPLLIAAELSMEQPL